MTDQKKDAYDSFWLNTLYPSAEEAFCFQQSPLAEIEQNCIVVLDANVLLLPYRLGATSLSEIEKVFFKLAKADRIFLPAQAVREFLKHRAEKIRDFVRELNRQASQINILGDRKVGFLEGDEDYQKLLEASDKIKSLKDETLKIISRVSSKLKSGIGTDPVSSSYRRVFEGRVVEISNLLNDELVKDLEWRFRHSIPPGYKDGSKLDGGIGDLIIWKTVLSLGEKSKASCIFVTEDSKSDWWVQSEGAFQPRLELVDEYRRASGGATLHLLSLSDLLATFGAEQGAIDEARKAEAAPHPHPIPMRRGLLDISRQRPEEFEQMSFVALSRLDVELEAESKRLSLAHNKVERRIKEAGPDLSEEELVDLMKQKFVLFEELKQVVQRRAKISNAIKTKIDES